MHQTEITKTYIVIGKLLLTESDKAEKEIKTVVWLCGKNKKEANNFFKLMKIRMDNERKKLINSVKQTGNKDNKELTGLAALFS